MVDGLEFERPAISATAAPRRRSPRRCPERSGSRARTTWPPDVADVDLVVNATSERDEVLVELAPPDRRSSICPTRAPRRRAAAEAAGAAVVDGLEVLVAQGAAAFELWTGVPAPVDVMRARSTLRLMALELVTAGESHGPALVAIVTGLPAGLVLERDAIDADLRRRQQGYGRSPRQQIEQDERRGARRAAARPHAGNAARARRAEPRPRELGVGDEPVAAGGRAARKGHEAGHAPAAGARGPRRRAQVRARRRARRARARERAAHRGDRRGGCGWRRRCSQTIGIDGRQVAVVGERSRAARRRGARRPRHGRRRRRGARARRSARSGVVRDEGRAPRRPARRDADGDAGGEGRRDRRRASSSRTSAAPRRTTRSFATSTASTARRIEPAASRAACRTARRSSSAPR